VLGDCLGLAVCMGKGALQSASVPSIPARLGRDMGGAAQPVPDFTLVSPSIRWSRTTDEPSWPSNDSSDRDGSILLSIPDPTADKAEVSNTAQNPSRGPKHTTLQAAEIKSCRKHRAFVAYCSFLHVLSHANSSLLCKLPPSPCLHRRGQRLVSPLMSPAALQALVVAVWSVHSKFNSGGCSLPVFRFYFISLWQKVAESLGVKSLYCRLEFSFILFSLFF